MFRQPSLKPPCQPRRLWKPVLPRKMMRGPSKAFFKAYGIYRSDVLLLLVNSGRGTAFRAVGESLRQPCPRIRSPLAFASRPSGPSPSYRTRRKERALPIVHDEFRRLFLEGSLASVALLRFTGHDQHKPIAGSNGTIYHRAVASVLTVCLSSGVHPNGLPCP